MADSDSFISEVSEEVRRDRLFALFRRWGWLGGLIVVILVGGAAYLEYNRAQIEARAQAFGDAIIAALDGDDPEARIAALESIETTGPEAELLLALFAASEASSSEDPGPAAARLRAAANGADLPPRYRDLAILKAEMIDPSEPAEARLVLGALAQPGAPYAGLASEQLALLDIREGNLDAGLDALRALERSAAATPALQQRASQLIVALGSGATLIDSRPEPEIEPEPPVAEETGTEEEAEPAPDAEEATENEADPDADTADE